MQYKSIELLEELSLITQENLNFGISLKSIPDEKLQFKIKDDSWSVLECLEHLNLYGNFYLPEIDKRIKASNLSFDDVFKSGFLGNKFANDMLPKENMKTMNTFKSKNPIHSNLNKEKVLNIFIKQQVQILDLLEIAKTKNLTKIKTSITLPLLKFRLGDTFRFVINHNIRHVAQAENILKIKIETK